MKVICNRGALLEALTVAGNVIATRTPKPILLCVKLSATKDSLTISATDLEASIRFTDHQVQVEQEGEVLVAADKLRDIVRESVDDTLSIEVIGETANIKGADSVFKIFTQKPVDFPNVPGFVGEAHFQVVGGSLKKLIARTQFATAKESSRYAFNGVLLNAKNKKIHMVATDGRRLASAEGDMLPGTMDKEGKKAIIPAKALGLIDKLVEDPEEAVGFQITETQIIVNTSSATMTSILLEGQFPPYDDVIPKDADKKMVAGTADFLSAIRRASLLANEESKGVRLNFTKKGLIITSRSPEAGEATINFSCKYEGADVEIGFNPNFLMEALKVVDTDEFSLELSAPNRPGLLKAGVDFQYVIMPVNLQ